MSSELPGQSTPAPWAWALTLVVLVTADVASVARADWLAAVVCSFGALVVGLGLLRSMGPARGRR